MDILIIIFIILLIINLLLINSIDYHSFIVDFLDEHKNKYNLIMNEKFAIINKLMFETFDDDNKIIDNDRKETLDIELDKIKNIHKFVDKFFIDLDILEKRHKFISCINLKYKNDFYQLDKQFDNNIEKYLK